MEKIEVYEKIKEKYEELKDEYESLKGEIVDFRESDEQKAYDSISDEVVKQTMYPREYEIYQKIKESEEKQDHFYTELYEKAKEIYIELKEKVNSFEEKIKVNEEYIQKLENEVEQLESQYEELSKSEDEKDILMAEDIKGQIKQKKSTITKFKKNIKKYKENIKQFNEKIKEFDDEYNFENELKVEDKTVYEPNEEEKKTDETIVEEEKKDMAEGSDQNADKITPKSETEKVVKGVGGAYIPEPETKEQEREEKTEEDKSKEIKKKIKDINDKIKNVKKIDDEEFDIITDALKDPSKYKEYGIRTGMFSNGKALLFAASQNLSKYSNQACKDIDVPKKERDNSTLLTWGSVKKIINDPEAIHTREQYLKDYVEANEGRYEEMSDEDKEKFDAAKKSLTKFSALKEAARGYRDRTVEKRKENKFLAFFNRGQDVKALNKGEEETTPVVEDVETAEPKAPEGDILDSLRGEVKEEIDIDVEDKPKSTSIEKDEP